VSASGDTALLWLFFSAESIGASIGDDIGVSIRDVVEVSIGDNVGVNVEVKVENSAGDSAREKRRNVVYWNPNGRSSMISCSSIW